MADSTFTIFIRGNQIFLIVQLADLSKVASKQRLEALEILFLYMPIATRRG